MIIAELIKHFKLIFRNWSTLLLIILAPLFLILLVGYAFSSEDLHDIRVGIISKESNIAPLREAITTIGETALFSQLEECLESMRLEHTHICIEIKGDLNPGKSSSAEVIFYFDNSRKRISLLLLSELKDYFGLTSEKISLSSTTEIFTRINDLIAFITQRIGEIDQANIQAQQIQNDLILRKEKLIAFNQTFTQRYTSFVKINKQVNIYARDLNESEHNLAQSITTLYQTTQELNKALALIPKTTNTTVIDTFNTSLTNLQKQLLIVNRSLSTTINQIDGAVLSLNQLEYDLNVTNQLLAQEIEQTQYYILLINQSVANLETLSKEAHEKINQFSSIDPQLAQAIAKPISQTFVPLLEQTTNIQIAFPTLLSTIIIFISMLFGNILTLLEITSKAYVRNILAPVNDTLYTAGITITNTLVVLIQVIALLIVAQLQFGTPIVHHLGPLLILSLLLIVTFTTLGMTLAYISKTIQTSILLTTFIALGFFLFSDSMIALEAMPKPAAAIAQYNPLVIASYLLRQLLFFQKSILTPALLYLISYFIISLLTVIWVSKHKNKQRF